MNKTNISAKEFTRIIRWSEEDHAFIGSLPELCGDCCHDPSDPLKVAAMLDDLAEEAYAACLRLNLPFDLPGSALVVIDKKKKNITAAQLVRD